MKYRWTFLAFLVAFLLQGSLLNLFSIWNTTPNLILCMTVVFALLYDGEYHAIIFGTLFGLFADLCFLDVAGVSALAYLIVALVIMMSAGYINKDHIISVEILIAAATVFTEFFRFTLLKIMGSGQDYMYLLKHIGPITLFNMVIATLIYMFVFQKFYFDKSESFMIQKYPFWSKK